MIDFQTLQSQGESRLIRSLSFSSTPAESYEPLPPRSLKRKENWDLLLDLERRALQLRDEVNRALNKDDWVNHANGIDLSISSNSHSVETLELHESALLDRGDINLTPSVPDSLAMKMHNCNWCSVEFQGVEIHGKYNGTSQVWIECKVPFSSHQDPYRFRATFPSRRLSLSLKEIFKFYVVPEDWKSGGEIYIRVSGVIPKNPKDRFQDTYWKATTSLKLNEILCSENLVWQGELILAEVSIKEKAKPFPNSVAGYLKTSFKLLGDRKSEIPGDKIENMSIKESVLEPKCLGFFLDGMKNASGARESIEGIYFKIKFFGESSARPVPLVTKQTCSNGCYFIVMIPPHESERPVVLEIFSIGDQGSKADVHSTLRGLVQLPLKDIYSKDSGMVYGPAADFMVSNPFTGKCVGYATARLAIGPPGDVKEYLSNLQAEHNNQLYEDIDIGSESNHSVLNSLLEDLLIENSHLESPIIANAVEAEVRELSLNIEDLEDEFDALKIQNQDSLSISVTVEMAMDLPLSDDPLANSFSSPFVNINETKTAPPNASVSFQVPEKFSEQFQIVWTDTIPRNTSPTWSFQTTLHVEKKLEYLQALKQKGHIVFKVWDFQESSEDFMTASRSRVNKSLIGTAKVNLEPLFSGLTEIYGWYPIRNHVGVSQGQILVKVDPSDRLPKILADLQVCGAVDISPSCACPRKKFDTGKFVYVQSNEPNHAEETWVWDGKEWVYKKLDHVASNISRSTGNLNSIIPEEVAKSPTFSGTVRELENLQRAVVSKYENKTVDSNTGLVLSAKDNQNADYSTDSVTEYPAPDNQIADNSNPFLDGSFNYSLENVNFD